MKNHLLFCLLLFFPDCAFSEIQPLTPAGDDIYVNVTGDTMTGQLTNTSSITVPGIISVTTITTGVNNIAVAFGTHTAQAFNEYWLSPAGFYDMYLVHGVSGGRLDLYGRVDSAPSAFTINPTLGTLPTPASGDALAELTVYVTTNNANNVERFSWSALPAPQVRFSHEVSGNQLRSDVAWADDAPDGPNCWATGECVRVGKEVYLSFQAARVGDSKPLALVWSHLRFDRDTDPAHPGFYNITRTTSTLVFNVPATSSFTWSVAGTTYAVLDAAGNFAFGSRASNQISTMSASGVLSLASALTVGNGGTGATSLTDGGILLGSGTGAITPSAVLANGELLIGDGTTDPTVAALTAGSGVTVTNGAGSITISTNATTLNATYVNAAGGDNMDAVLRVGVAATPFGNTNIIASKAAAVAVEAQNTSNGVQAVMQAGTSSGDYGTVSAHALALYTSAAERARIDASGNFLINTTVAGATLDVNGNAQFGSGVTKSTFSTSGSLSLDAAATLTLGNSTPTGNGSMAYSQTNSRLGVGDGTNSQQIILGKWDSWTPTWGGFSVAPTGGTSRYARIGNTVVAVVDGWSAGTSNATATTITLPVAARSALAMSGYCHAMDNGTFSNTPCRVDGRTTSATADIYMTYNADAWTGSGSKLANFTITYEAN